MKRNEIFLITIGGGTGSGKTTLAREIIRKIGKKSVLLLHIDDYYKDLSHMKKEEREKVNFDHPNSIDWELLKDHIKKLLSGKSVKIPKYSFLTHVREGFKSVKPRKVIILEGIFALYDDEINKLSKLRIYIDTESDIRFIRRLKRDVNELGREVEEVIEKWIRVIKPMHEAFVEPTRKKAHIIVPEDPDGRMRERAVEVVCSMIEKLLNSNER